MYIYCFEMYVYVKVVLEVPVHVFGWVYCVTGWRCIFKVLEPLGDVISLTVGWAKKNIVSKLSTVSKTDAEMVLFSFFLWNILIQ